MLETLKHEDENNTITSVSYTHLDVYKRQVFKVIATTPGRAITAHGDIKISFVGERDRRAPFTLPYGTYFHFYQRLVGNVNCKSIYLL